MTEPFFPQADKYVSLPGSKLAVPEPEDCFPMSHSDWRRIRARVAGIRNPLPWATNMGWVCIGIVATAALAYMPWVGARSALDAKAKVHYAWVSPAILAAGAAALALAVISFTMGAAWKRREREDVRQVLADMDGIYTPHAGSAPQHLQPRRRTTDQLAGGGRVRISSRPPMP